MTPRLTKETWVETCVAELKASGYNVTANLQTYASQLCERYRPEGLSPAEVVRQELASLE